MAAVFDVAVPTSPEEITPEWLSAALADVDGSISVSAIAVEPIGVGVGVMSLLFRLTPTYASGRGPDSLVAKIAPPYEMVRTIAAGYRFYETEVAIYRNLSPELGMRPPRLYYAAYNPDSDDFVILMEDLGRLRCDDQLEGCPIEDARAVIHQLALHHAHWWQDERLGESYVPRFSREPYPQFNAQAASMSWPIIDERFGHLIPERIRDLASRWPEVGPPLLVDIENHPLTLCHGDVRLDNIFFHDDDASTVSLVDWAIASAASGVNDLGYFMSQSLTVENRRAYETELTRLYYDTLLEHGVTGYPFDDFWLGYRRAILFCLCYPLQGGAGELVNDRAMALVTSMLERSMSAILDLDADEVAL
jgi:ecdysteroid kinase